VNTEVQELTSYIEEGKYRILDFYAQIFPLFYVAVFIQQRFGSDQLYNLFKFGSISF
jgi:hypothetical protein